MVSIPARTNAPRTRSTKRFLVRGEPPSKRKKDPWASPPASHIIQHRPDRAKLVSRCTDPYCHAPSELVCLRTLQKDPHLRWWGASVHAHVAPCQMYRQIKRGLCRDRDLARPEETEEARHRGCPHQRRIVGHRRRDQCSLHLKQNGGARLAISVPEVDRALLSPSEHRSGSCATSVARTPPLSLGNPSLSGHGELLPGTFLSWRRPDPPSLMTPQSSTG